MNTRIFTGVIAILLLIVTVSSLSEESMLGLFKKAVDVEVFPEVSGRLTLNGEAVEGLTLTRGFLYLNAMEQGIEDQATTDKNGQFRFPNLTWETKYPNNPLASQIIAQRITVDDSNFPDVDGVYLWSTESRGLKHISYFQERLLSLNCELTESEIIHQIIDEAFPDGSVRYEVGSICRWPSLEKVEVEKRKKFGKW
ncbi:carboxypeptidase-like regulatory domain-containing protein [Shewanella sp. 1_MG-2023]|uniref:DUF6795 domain-containing protein n=1 Tax=unclassified Shewanella TaxID=196818 RepID=UPI000C855B5F|nr:MULTISPECIES: carboxypeptidase-like regulatory domain-containing protein [unclassified Shewanella]MDO6611320.1 carboxypeptidase-like regulatory domain-containing protein [Shewanella sp. 7_MG-2023]MDO6771175.1 carboxypeptidase-like regulatory domain-containing protein [Shewanella sp. 2_MG-2023]MDO6795856.1 carboxypeptidase-like regulatory domain-containing protein [Shewanella sp. 1_MG-2023]PMG79554.1 hypothetical protein BCU84_05290 [Shewanella sp. 10N.286.51.B7]